MYGLPQSTEIKKQLPKKAIYAKFNMPTSQREHFDADIARIDIEVGVSKATVPALAEGEEIKEFYVLGIQLKRKEYDPKNILMLTKLLPYKMVFAFHYELSKGRTLSARNHVIVNVPVGGGAVEVIPSYGALYIIAVGKIIVHKVKEARVFHRAV